MEKVHGGCGCPVGVHAAGAHPAVAFGTDGRVSNLPLPSVHHVGLVVRNRERTLAALCALFGRGAFRTEVPFPPARFRTGIDTAHLHLGFVWTGGMLVEVIEPLDDVSVQGRFLKDHGDGLHHLAFVVPSIVDQLAAFGVRHADLLADGTITGNEVKWAYVDDGIVPGVVIELIEQNAAAEQFFNAVYSATGAPFPA
jgi:methylmalonyl-CoA/ethylmalonyl-CoA epimerase